MDSSRIYATWPDGVFSYECRGCGDCCKGLGIGLDAAGGQVARLVRLYPATAPFLRKRGSTWTAFNPRGRCWFFDDSGLCRIESDHGRATKPASCRLFPFNRVFRLGSWVIVDYNSVVCPLRALPDDAVEVGSSGRVSHAEVIDEIASVADPGVVGTELPAEDAEAEGRALVTRERAIAAACFAAARAGTPAGEVDTVWRAQVRNGTPAQARARVGRAFEALSGVPWRLPAEPTLTAALWLTPSLRFNELYGPRRYGPRHELAGALADMWLAWLGALAAGAELAGRTLDLREATSIWSEVVPLAYLAARWADAPTLEPGPVELPGAGDPEDLVRRTAQAWVDNRSRRQPLANILAPILDGRSPAERAATARMLEPLLPRVRWRRPRR